MRDKKQLIIRSADDVSHLRLRRKGRQRGFNDIRLDTGKLDKSDERILEDRLNHYYFACGCAEGTAVGIIATAAYLWYSVEMSGGITDLGWVHALYALLAFFLGSGAGKTAGLIYANAQLSRLIDDLTTLLREKPSDQELAARPRCAHNS